jgi:hypothetical protein
MPEHHPISAAELIDRMERETGSRVDANNGDNPAIAGLFGALARALGQSQHREQDDVAAGVLIRHQMTPAFAEEQRWESMMTSALAAGVSPDDFHALTNIGNPKR